MFVGLIEQNQDLFAYMRNPMAILVNTNDNINLLPGSPGVSSEGIQLGAEHGKIGRSGLWCPPSP